METFKDAIDYLESSPLPDPESPDCSNVNTLSFCSSSHHNLTDPSSSQPLLIDIDKDITPDTSTSESELSDLESSNSMPSVHEPEHGSYEPVPPANEFEHEHFDSVIVTTESEPLTSDHELGHDPMPSVHEPEH